MYLYPYPGLEPGLEYPTHRQFEVRDREDGKGKAVITLTGHARGEMVARFTGIMVPYRTQHSLQVNPSLHIIDSHFVGFLAHSCAPNVFVDMQGFEVWALEDIEPETALTMDYAATEDELFRQFRCLCGASSCRHWITGRKERISGEGLFYTQEVSTDIEQCARWQTLLNGGRGQDWNSSTISFSLRAGTLPLWLARVARLRSFTTLLECG